ncbi:MAG: TerC family protein [Pseudomonadota bacterium]
MDFGYFGNIVFDWKFISGFLSIVVIDLILAGDNAVVIAMAVRSLPKEQRRKGIIFGSGAAVALRVVLTFFVAQLLQINFLKLAGGVLILWIAVKLFIEGVPEDKGVKESKSLGQAVRMIVVADLTMATDNMLAVAGASHGNFFLLLFGLALSIPLIVLTSNLLSMLMDKYPVIIYIGAAILGRVGAEMIMTDPFIVDLLSPSKALQYTVEVVFAVGVIVFAKLWMKWVIRSEKGGVTEESTDTLESERK